MAFQTGDLSYSKMNNIKRELVVQRWIAILRVFQSTFETVLQWIRLQGFFIGGKTRNIAIQLVLQ